MIEPEVGEDFLELPFAVAARTIFCAESSEAAPGVRVSSGRHRVGRSPRERSGRPGRGRAARRAERAPPAEPPPSEALSAARALASAPFLAFRASRPAAILLRDLRELTRSRSVEARFQRGVGYSLRVKLPLDPRAEPGLLHARPHRRGAARSPAVRARARLSWRPAKPAPRTRPRGAVGAASAATSAVA